MSATHTSTASVRSAWLRVALSAAAVLAFTLLLAPPLSAGGGEVVNTAMGNLVAEVLSPIFNVLQFLIVVGAVIMALVSAFQASRGNGGKWLQAGLLLVVALIAAMPATIASWVDPAIGECITALKSGNQSGWENCTAE